GRLTVSDSRVAALKGSTLEGVGSRPRLVLRGGAAPRQCQPVCRTGGQRPRSTAWRRTLSPNLSKFFERYNQSGYVRIVVRFTRRPLEAAVEDIDPDYITVQVVSYNASALRPLDRSSAPNWPIFMPLPRRRQRHRQNVSRCCQSDFCGGGGSEAARAVLC
uniref:Kinesin motor domain-containing protein n=1 Tax=Macrostomum lignano TaxID=282301 RepID=A0A1I8FLA6_9PLAT